MLPFPSFLPSLLLSLLPSLPFFLPSLFSLHSHPLTSLPFSFALSVSSHLFAPPFLGKCFRLALVFKYSVCYTLWNYDSYFVYRTHGKTRAGTLDSMEVWNLSFYTILRLQRKNLTKQTNKRQRLRHLPPVFIKHLLWTSLTVRAVM